MFSFAGVISSAIAYPILLIGKGIWNILMITI